MTEQNQQNNEAKEIQKTEQPNPLQLVSEDSGDFQCYLDTAKFNQLYRVANMFAGSELVPVQYRQKPNDCFIALQMAMRLKCDPMAFMQGTYVVYGRPGMEGKLAIALINSRGPFAGPVQWRFEGTGKDRKCTAYAKHKITGDICEATVSWEMAEKEGWTKKSGSKWLTMPDLMFQYRSAAFLGRLYCPEVLYGMQTVEEIVDVGPTSPPEENIAPVLGVPGLLKHIESQEVKKETPPAEPPDSDVVHYEGGQTTVGDLKQKAAAAVKKMKTAPKPKDFCPYCKGIINDLEKEATKNKAGELECNTCGYVLVERP